MTDFLKQIQKRVAQTAVGASALRNQGAGGLIQVCRNYFEHKIDLNKFRDELTTMNYEVYLNNLTEDLKDEFPIDGKSWGAARKGLNLFFRDVVYNKYLADYLNIPSAYDQNLITLRNMEIPLDKDAGTKLNELFPSLPKWKSIKQLELDESKLFQEKANLHALKLGTVRIHLDLDFWRSK